MWDMKSLNQFKQHHKTLAVPILYPQLRQSPEPHKVILSIFQIDEVIPGHFGAQLNYVPLQTLQTYIPMHN